MTTIRDARPGLLLCENGQWLFKSEYSRRSRPVASAVAALRADGFVPRGVVTVLDRRPEADRQDEIEGVPLRHVFSLEDLGLEDAGVAALAPSPRMPDGGWEGNTFP